MSNYTTKDSGNRTTFSTGAMRDLPGGKGRYDLISPIALRRLADVYERGSKKYNDRNWEKGIPLSNFMDSALRHLNQYREGLRDEDHLGQAAWNIFGLLHTETMIKRGLLPKELNDLPCYIVAQDAPDNEVVSTPDPLGHARICQLALAAARVMREIHPPSDATHEYYARTHHLDVRIAAKLMSDAMVQRARECIKNLMGKFRDGAVRGEDNL